jgi:hypothetical protein
MCRCETDDRFALSRPEAVATAAMRLLSSTTDRVPFELPADVSVRATVPPDAKTPETLGNAVRLRRGQHLRRLLPAGYGGKVSVRYDLNEATAAALRIKPHDSRRGASTVPDWAIAESGSAAP